MSTQSETFEWALNNAPLARPSVFSRTKFDHEVFPGRHLLDFYDDLYRAITEQDAKKNVARFMPRGHGKTEVATKIFPAWLAVNWPEIRIAIVSHKKGVATDRSSQAVSSIERVCEEEGIPVYDSGKTTIQLQAGRENKEKTIEPHSIRSDIEGKHFDVILFDDIATFGNQTSKWRDTISRDFEDHLDNLGAKRAATCLPHGSVNVVIGTRKDERDVYREHILRQNDHEWDGCVARNEGQPNWNAKVFRATPDWHVIENEDYVLLGDDGETYESYQDLPHDVGITNNGVRPTSNFRVLWDEFEPSNSVLFDIVGKSGSTAVWQCENQQNPEATQGQVLDKDWIVWEDRLPQDPDQYQWYAGLDFANPNDRDPDKRSSGDYWALAVEAHDKENDTTFVVDLWRDRELDWKGAATDFVTPNLQSHPVHDLLVESNFTGDEIADTIDEHTDYNVLKTDSSGKKEERLESMANKFQQGKIRIIGDPTDQKWESFLQDEWLPFPDANHDDRMDSIEIARRGPDTAVKSVKLDL